MSISSVKFQHEILSQLVWIIFYPELFSESFFECNMIYSDSCGFQKCIQIIQLTTFIGGYFYQYSFHVRFTRLWDYLWRLFSAYEERKNCICVNWAPRLCLQYSSDFIRHVCTRTKTIYSMRCSASSVLIKTRPLVQHMRAFAHN